MSVKSFSNEAFLYPGFCEMKVRCKGDVVA